MNDLSAAELQRKYREIANSSPHWFATPEFKALARELKRRKLKTFAQLEAAVAAERA